MFADKAKIIIKSGKGGDGCVSFRREPFVPNGGPDGGNGGNGGDVVFFADANMSTLLDFRYKKKYEAEKGGDGRKKKQFGKSGSDLVIPIPVGTVIFDDDSGLMIKDMAKTGESFIVLKGGRGGKGNAHFKSSVRQAPNFAEAGETAVEKKIRLELKLLADVGLLGFPNVGKSTLLKAVTRAEPGIDNYHFTTLSPNLGVVKCFDKSFVMADIPGLIEGAHKGAGLGLEFLRHVERTRLLIHIVDVSGSEGRDPVSDFDLINKELASYEAGIAQKPQLVVANKIDLATKDQVERFKTAMENKGYSIFPISAIAQEGVKLLMSAVFAALEDLPPLKELGTEAVETEKTDDHKVFCSKEGKTFVLTGKHLEKIYRSTNFNDMGSIHYLYKYIDKRGGLNQMKKMGLKDGDTVRIYGYELEYYDD